MKTKSEVVAYNPDLDYIKSNILVSAKYRSSLLENRLLAVSLAQIPKSIEDSSGDIVVRIPGSELKKLFNLKDYGNLYSRLDETASKMTGRSIGYSNPDLQEFEYMSVVTYAKFKDNIFECHFNNEMRKFLKNIESNFTSFNLKIMLNWKSIYTFRLYEVLKSRCYVPKGKPKTNNFEITYNLNELKLELGVVNAELAEVRSILNSSRKAPDYDKAVEKSPERVLDNWQDFKKRCLDVAVNEINSKENVNMHVEYDTQKQGRGGRIYGIIFKIHLNSVAEEDSNDIIELSENEKADFYDLVMETIEERLKLRDIISISESANYNLEIIKEKYEISKHQNIDNLVGWLIKAIKDDYSQPIKSNKIIDVDFEQREYNFDELKKEIL